METINSKHIDYYRQMLRIRMVEEAIANNYHNEIRQMHTPIHLSDGQEAVAVGVCTNLNPEDVIFSTHRNHAHYLAKGGNLNKMIAELHNKYDGCCKGKGASMHLADKEVNVAVASSIVAGNVPIATGYALAFKQEKLPNISVSFFGDGATEEGVVYESICFAKLHELPVVFVCENNEYAISTPLKYREISPNVSEKFSAIIDSVVIDGNNVIEVAEVSKRLIKEMRNNPKPVFIECKTYRMRDHHNTGTGLESGYRTQEELDYWSKKSPIDRLKNELMNRGLLDKESNDCIINSIKKEIEKSFEFAINGKLPEYIELYKDL